jgi:predicted  nucleic acid-binding Zn-ribbon protein
MPIDASKFVIASRELVELAKASEAAGDGQLAEKFFKAAAEVELASDELQACWGGAFNGQEGRRALFLDLVERLDLAAIVETGTFRGSTTEWMAERFDGPILTCEHAPAYFFQAQQRLSRFANVTVRLNDSRAFLKETLPELREKRPVLFYLDAHWHNDLPLSEEVKIILAECADPVIMIDDFRVPFDPGYEWDDYGPGNRVDLEQLKWLQSSDCRFFFPSLPSSEETGAARGVCVIATKSAEQLASSPLLRNADWRDWKLIELEADSENKTTTPVGNGEEDDKRTGKEFPTEPVSDQPVSGERDINVLRAQLVAFEQRQADRLFRLSTMIQEGLGKNVLQSAEQWLSEGLHSGLTTLEERVDQLGRSVVQYFEHDDERTNLGRALVEERARNLEASRVRHELEARLQAAESEATQARRAESEAVEARRKLESRVQTIEEEAARARHELESRVNTSEARLAGVKRELDASRQELKATQDRHLALQLRLKAKDEEAFSAQQRLEWSDAEALREGQALRVTLANLKRNVATARATIESLHASRALKVVRIVSGAPLSTAEKAAADLASAEQGLAQIELISKAMLQRAAEPVRAATPNVASEPASAPITRDSQLVTLMRASAS